MIEKEIFRNKLFLLDKLCEYGFIKQGQEYVYTKNIMNDQFQIVLTYSDTLVGKILDLNFEEEYTNFRIENSTSSFVNKVKDEYESLLNDIALSCCITTDFNSEQANRISMHIRTTYAAQPEYIFEKNPGLGVFRIQKKWFAMILQLHEFTNLKDVELLNIKCDPKKQESILKIEGIYPAYHMNKKNWITVVLNDTVSDDTIFELIKDSYHLISNRKECHEWIVPANPKYYDIIHAFHNGHMFWKVIKNIHTGDIVYFYVAKPYSAILFKCLVTNENEYDYMMLQLLDEYDPSLFSLDVLKTYGVRTVRGPRSIPKSLIDYIEKVSQHND